jgi:hypothetical protein
MVLLWGIEKRAVENMDRVEGLLGREICSRPHALPMFPLELQHLEGKIWLLWEGWLWRLGEIEIRI